MNQKDISEVMFKSLPQWHKDQLYDQNANATQERKNDEMSIRYDILSIGEFDRTEMEADIEAIVGKYNFVRNYGRSFISYDQVAHIVFTKPF